MKTLIDFWLSLVSISSIGVRDCCFSGHWGSSPSSCSQVMMILMMLIMMMMMIIMMILSGSSPFLDEDENEQKTLQNVSM